jgi:branched-chain amino acid transport system ATP-binding protein
MSDYILELHDIQTYIGQFHILEGVHFRVKPHTITAILGRNGAGKTTTLRSIMGLTPIKSGQILFEGRDISRMRPFKVAQLGIGYVPEHRAIFKDLTVAENLRIAERDKNDFEKKADLIFELFPDLKRLYKMSGGSLSGGQQQMLSIARALVPDNRLLLIDEPSEGLAPVIIEAMMQAIQQLTENATVVLVEQNFRMASQLAETYVIIEEGHTAAMGSMADLAADQALIHRYLGAA